MMRRRIDRPDHRPRCDVMLMVMDDGAGQAAASGRSHGPGNPLAVELSGSHRYHFLQGPPVRTYLTHAVCMYPRGHACFHVFDVYVTLPVGYSQPHN
jgi:hypothetical protein